MLKFALLMIISDISIRSNLFKFFNDKFILKLLISAISFLLLKNPTETFSTIK